MNGLQLVVLVELIAAGHTETRDTDEKKPEFKNQISRLRRQITRGLFLLETEIAARRHWRSQTVVEQDTGLLSVAGWLATDAIPR